MTSSAHLTWSAHSDKGRLRTTNQDSFLALTFDAQDVRLLGKIGEIDTRDADCIFAVSDGMGGARSGDFASRIATQSITRLLPRHFRNRMPDISEVLHTLCITIHAEMLLQGRCYEECRGMGATLSLCWFQPGVMHFAHIGDSRIYHLSHASQPAALNQLTHDHTQVGWMFRQGQLTEHQRRSHPRRNVLTQALGAGVQIITPQIGSLEYQPGDRFLICSDGINDSLWDDALALRMAAPDFGENIGPELVQAAIAAGSRDNATAIVITIPS